MGFYGWCDDLMGFKNRVWWLFDPVGGWPTPLAQYAPLGIFIPCPVTPWIHGIFTVFPRVFHGVFPGFSISPRLFLGFFPSCTGFSWAAGPSQNPRPSAPGAGRCPDPAAAEGCTSGCFGHFFRWVERGSPIWIFPLIVDFPIKNGDFP